MTKQEFSELYDSLFYGHDVELSVAGQHYFIEWCDSGIEIYLMVDGNGRKIATIAAAERSDTLAKLLEFVFCDHKNLNNSFSDFEIIDIE